MEHKLKDAFKVARRGRTRVWLLALPTLLLAMTSLTALVMGNNPWPQFVLMLFFGFPAWRGLRATRLAGLYPEYYAALIEATKPSLRQLAAELRRDEKLVRRHLEGLSQLKLLPPLSIHANGRVRFLSSLSARPSGGKAGPGEQRVQCPACGANGSVLAGRRNRCDYCGGTLSLLPPGKQSA